MVCLHPKEDLLNESSYHWLLICTDKVNLL